MITLESLTNNTSKFFVGCVLRTICYVCSKRSSRYSFVIASSSVWQTKHLFSESLLRPRSNLPSLHNWREIFKAYETSSLQTQSKEIASQGSSTLTKPIIAFPKLRLAMTSEGDLLRYLKVSVANQNDYLLKHSIYFSSSSRNNIGSSTFTKENFLHGFGHDVAYSRGIVSNWEQEGCAFSFG